MSAVISMVIAFRQAGTENSLISSVIAICLVHALCFISINCLAPPTEDELLRIKNEAKEYEIRALNQTQVEIEAIKNNKIKCTYEAIGGDNETYSWTTSQECLHLQKSKLVEESKNYEGLRELILALERIDKQQVPCNWILYSTEGDSYQTSYMSVEECRKFQKDNQEQYIKHMEIRK